MLTLEAVSGFPEHVLQVTHAAEPLLKPSVEQWWLSFALWCCTPEVGGKVK